MNPSSSNRLSNSDQISLTNIRQELHRHPEIAGEEQQTAERIRAFLAPTSPDQVIDQLGGHGIAFIYDSGIEGPSVLLRCELHALPIEEIGELTYRSTVAGKAHLCGHDGHMSMLLAMGLLLGRQRPERGKVILMFQPAEETGAGAPAVVADPKYQAIIPDYAFAIHNWPGIPMGAIWIKSGVVNCASRGMIYRFTGRTSHAAEPQKGVSPMRAMNELSIHLESMSSTAPYNLVTITHAKLGEQSFGISPGEGEVWATLRTESDADMAQLCERALLKAQQLAEQYQLTLELEEHDVFLASVNDEHATALAQEALDKLNLPHEDGELPERASEDFGAFGHQAKSAMLFLGSGVETPALHNPDYDFPDELIPVGARIFMGIVEHVLGSNATR